MVFLAEIYVSAHWLRIRPGEQGEFIRTIKTQTVHKIVAGFVIVHLGQVAVG